MSGIDDDDAEPGDGPITAAASGFSTRLREAIGTKTYDEVAKRAGIGRRSFSRYVKGELPKLPALIGLADACGVTIEWLASGRGTPLKNVMNIQHPDIDAYDAISASEKAAGAPGTIIPLPGGSARQYVPIPRFNIQAAAGSGALAEHEQIVEYFAFDLDFVRNHLRRDPKNLVLIEARGDSMDPNIRDGDILAVDLTLGQPLHNAQLYVIRVGDNLMVKRLELRLDGAVVVHSDNPRYAPETVPRSDLNTLNILGQVILVSAPPR